MHTKTVSIYDTLTGKNHGGTYEVIAVSESGKTITLRAMHATLKKDCKMDAVAGGFCAHVRNNGGEWDLSSDVNGKIVKARLTKRGWRVTHGGNLTLGGARMYYDYNF